MPSAVAPFDRAIALACTVQTLRGRSLYVRCRCLTSTVWPVRLLLKRDSSVQTRTLADMIVFLRCSTCGGAVADVVEMVGGVVSGS